MAKVGRGGSTTVTRREAYRASEMAMYASFLRPDFITVARIRRRVIQKQGRPKWSNRD